jgi:hypothetical protein
MSSVISLENRQAQADARYAALSRLVGLAEVGAEDVTDLRRVFVDGWPEQDELDTLFAIDAVASQKCPEWTTFLVETVTDHIVWQTRPTGMVDDAQAEWLLASADRSQSLPAFAVLVNILAEAHSVPVWLVGAVKTRARRGWPGLDKALAAAVVAIGPESAEAA